MKQVESITVRTPVVSCDGGNSALGHPRVFLTFREDERECVCPYCSRHFIFDAGRLPPVH